MRYVCLACDFDGTLATNGVVGEEVMQALARVTNSGRHLVLVTGRRLEDLLLVFPHVNLFDYLVLENGAVLYQPATRVARLLAEPPPHQFIEMLNARGVTPVDLGRVVVATWHPQERKVLEVVQELGLDLHISFNKGAVMVLPPGINKGSGLAAALRELGLSKHNVVGIGDAENDHAMLAACECAVAVANALAMVKEYADVTVSKDHGQGVVELIDTLLSTDLGDYQQLLKRHGIALGTTCNNGGAPVTISAYNYRVLIAGPSQSGKSTVTMSLLEQFASAGYQYCVIDPEGEYDRAPRAVTIGNEHYPPDIEDIVRVLDNPDDNVVVNLLAVTLTERAELLARIFTSIQNLRRMRGRPHWIVIDEAHHMLHPYWDQTFEPIWHEPGAVVVVTIDPSEISQTVLAGVDLAIAVGPDPQRTLGTFAARVERSLPEMSPVSLGWGEALAWFKGEGGSPLKMRVVSSPVDRHRHLRKYSEGDLGRKRSFYFTGPEGRMNIKCQNLFLFMQIGEGIDDATWLFHLRRGDYSAWFDQVIKDQALADETAKVEQDWDLPACDSRAKIKQLIERRYTLPARLLG
jgi:hydroxymethylpyrimidine pyrophosphatase-like HAD family hydrolase